MRFTLFISGYGGPWIRQESYTSLSEALANAKQVEGSGCTIGLSAVIVDDSDVMRDSNERIITSGVNIAV